MSKGGEKIMRGLREAVAHASGRARAARVHIVHVPDVKATQRKLETTKIHKSKSMSAVHEMMDGLHKSGAIDKQTMREFDEGCLAAMPVLGPDQIKAIRESEKVSQPVFARYLNVSRNLVSDWERGVKSPGGPALRLLSIVDRKGLRAIV